MCRRRRAAGRSVCVAAACQELFKWAAPAVDISLRPAGISAHVSLPPSSPVNCRTRRWRPGFHQNTAHSLFWAVFANFSHALRWRTCRYRVSPTPVWTWNGGKHTELSLCRDGKVFCSPAGNTFASLQRPSHLPCRPAHFTGAVVDSGYSTSVCTDACLLLSCAEFVNDGV